MRTNVVVDSAATEGRYAVLEVAATRGDGPPPHLHRREDEAVLVLAGALDVCVDGFTARLEPGETARLPRGVPHRVTAASDDVRWLSVLSPAGYDALVRACGGGEWEGDEDDVAALLTAAGVDRVRTSW